MGTGKGMLDQRFRALRLSYACFDLAKFGFRKGGPQAAPSAPGRQSARISRSVNPASWQSWIKARRSALEEP